MPSFRNPGPGPVITPVPVRMPPAPQLQPGKAGPEKRRRQIQIHPSAAAEQSMAKLTRVLGPGVPAELVLPSRMPYSTPDANQSRNPAHEHTLTGSATLPGIKLEGELQRKGLGWEVSGYLRRTSNTP
ncbi:hypothetical protein B0H14DRAFT_3153310 [Mycena olivaceomarginata]|nr:hypothetical protein B0H14DRAFT_3153310 [Mycena olivaceomarginata]